jgi:hypothetical protein
MTWRLATVVLTLAITCLMAPNVDAGDGKSFSNRDVDGPTAFDFDGFVTDPAGSGTLVPAASVGRFVADGRGNLLEGERTLMVGGTFLFQQQHFTCTYDVRPNGMGSARCTIDTGAIETFDFVIVERKKEAYFTSTNLGTVLRGRTKRQH